MSPLLNTMSCGGCLVLTEDKVGSMPRCAEEKVARYRVVDSSDPNDGNEQHSRGEAAEQLAAQPRGADAVRMGGGNVGADVRSNRGRRSPASACSRGLHRRPAGDGCGRDLNVRERHDNLAGRPEQHPVLEPTAGPVDFGVEHFGLRALRCV